jgi:protoporphyrin/coproporphyrin ferrochelatase
MTPEPSFKHSQARRIGVLLVNLGTPDAPTPAAVRRYLKEFLADPRVVEIARPIWWLILNGIILNTRPAKVAKKYAEVWLPEGSPLRVYTERQGSLLRGALKARLQPETVSQLVVEVAMRYGNPSLPAALERLRAQHCDRLLVVPLYPQYASSTTGSTLARVMEILSTYRNMPAVRTVRNFHDDPHYIDAVVRAIEAAWMQQGRPDHLLMSFHGLPRFHLDKGDPYHCECHKTARLVRERLGWPPEKVSVSFQSRFGRAEWLKPYTTETLKDLAKRNFSRLDVCCPGFTADCLETLEEIAVEGREDYQSAGGGEYRYIPLLNDSDAFVHALAMLVQTQVAGWLDAPDTAEQLVERASRARAIGAPS